MNDGSAEARHHPSYATLLSYVTGALSSGHLYVIDVHVAGCPACAASIAFLGRVGDHLLAPRVPASLLEQVLAALDDERAPQDGRVTPGTGVFDAAAAASHFGARRTRWIAPGIRQSTIADDPEGRLHLIRVRSRTALPHHGHRGLELTTVLQGSFLDGPARYGVGDLCEVDEENEHLLIAGEPDECVCLIASEKPVRFSGRIARMLQPLLPF